MSKLRIFITSMIFIVGTLVFGLYLYNYKEFSNEAEVKEYYNKILGSSSRNHSLDLFSTGLPFLTEDKEGKEFIVNFYLTLLIRERYDDVEKFLKPLFNHYTPSESEEKDIIASLVKLQDYKIVEEEVKYELRLLEDKQEPLLLEEENKLKELDQMKKSIANVVNMQAYILKRFEDGTYIGSFNNYSEDFILKTTFTTFNQTGYFVMPVLSLGEQQVNTVSGFQKSLPVYIEVPAPNLNELQMLESELAELETQNQIYRTKYATIENQLSILNKEDESKNIIELIVNIVFETEKNNVADSEESAAKEVEEVSDSTKVDKDNSSQAKDEEAEDVEEIVENTVIEEEIVPTIEESVDFVELTSQSVESEFDINLYETTTNEVSMIDIGTQILHRPYYYELSNGDYLFVYSENLFAVVGNELRVKAVAYIIDEPAFVDEDTDIIGALMKGLPIEAPGVDYSTEEFNSSYGVMLNNVEVKMQSYKDYKMVLLQNIR